MAGKRPVIAFGPGSTLPSWYWVGQDTARELARYYDVRVYNSFQPIADCDVIFIVKQAPPADFVRAAMQQQTKLVYLPIDRYVSRKQIVLDAFLLQHYDLVVSHCERLIPLLAPHCRDIRYVDHHAKYALQEMARYRQTGYVLWIGGCQYLPYLLRWLNDHPLDAELRILTDVGNLHALEKGNELASRLIPGVKLSPDSSQVMGHRIFPWSESLQLQMMAECKAALDIKEESDFNQMHKPATKAQKFIASGIPFAVNCESYSYEYFSSRGIELATPDHPRIWFSRKYWQNTQSWGKDLRLKLSIESVGLTYKTFIDQLLAHSGTTANPQT